MIKKFIEKCLESEFNRNFLKLLSGGAIAAIISVIVIPITTRLYSPEQFGLFQIFMSILLVLSSISSFKYELAIVLPKSKIRSNGLLKLSLIVLIITTLIYCLLFAVLGTVILTWLSATDLIPYMYLIPISIAIAGFYQIMQYVVVNAKSYGELSTNKVVQTSLNQASVISVGFTGGTSAALIISFASAQLISSLLLLKRHGVKNIFSNKRYLKLLALKYKKFPLINSVNVFLNTISLQLPVFMLAKFSTAEVVGIYMLASRLLDMPLSLLNNSVTQVFIKSAAEAYNHSALKLKMLYISLLKKLAYVGLLAVVIVYVFSDIAVNVFLGEEWSQVTVFMYILIVGKFFQFLNSPLSSTLMIINKQELGMYLIMFSLLIRYLSMYLTSFDEMYMLIALSISSSIFFVFYNIVSYKVIK